MPRKPIFYGYIRVSTNRQVETGFSLKAQKRAIRRTYKHSFLPRGYEWGGIFIEKGASAWKFRFTKRRVGFELNARLVDGDHICFHKGDRAFRNVADQALMSEDWKERGVTFSFNDMPGVDTSSPVGACIVSIMAAIAQMESARRSERLIESNEERRKMGLHQNATVIYGAVKHRGVAYEDGSMDVVRAIVWMKEVDGLSRWQIAGILLRHRVRYKRSGQWHEWGHMRVERAYEQAKERGIEPSIKFFPRDRYMLYLKQVKAKEALSRWQADEQLGAE